MKMLGKLLTGFAVSSVAGLGMTLITPQSSRADDIPRQVNPLQDLNSQQSSDPFTRMDSGDGLGLFDLIRRASSSTPSWDQYSSEQNQSLDSAASEFRARQREIIQGQQQAPTNTVTTPQPAQ